MTASERALIVKALRKYADSGALDARAAELLADRIQFTDRGEFLG